MKLIAMMFAKMKTNPYNQKARMLAIEEPKRQSTKMLNSGQLNRYNKAN